MKAKPVCSTKQKLARLAAIGALALGTLAWARAPIARAAATAATDSRIGAALAQVKSELNLTSEQQVKIQSILREAVPQGIAIHDSTKFTPNQKRTRLRELRTTTRSRIEKLLTPEQRNKAEVLLASARPRIQARLQQVADELDVSEAQKSEIKPILAGAFKQGVAIKDDMSLTLAQKFSKAQHLRTETRAKLTNVLTPVQMVKLDRIVDAAQKDIATIVRTQRRENIG